MVWLMLLTPGSAAVVLHSQEETIMPEVGTRDIPLNWDVFITPGIPIATSDLPPETGVVSGYSVNTHLRQARRRSSRRLYDRQAG